MLQRYGFVGGKIVADAETSSVSLYVAPDEEERRAIAARHPIDPHDLASALDPDELGRIDSGPEMTTIILKTPRNYSSDDQLLFTVTSIGLFMFPGELVVITTDPVDLFDDRMVRQVADIRDAVLKILYGIIAHFLGHLRVINMLSDSLEKRVNASMGNRYLLDMFTLEKSLVYFINGIGSNQMVLDKIRANAARFKLSEDQRAIFDDIVIENQQCSRQAEIYSNILTGLMDARGSVVNNNLNILIKRLTIISVIFMPMNVLAGMGGMSEFSAWTQGIPWPVAYGFALLFLVGVGSGTWWILKKFGIERNELEIFGRRKRNRR